MANRAHAPLTVLFPFMGSSAGGSHISTFHLAKALQDENAFDVSIAGFAGTSILAEARAFDLPTLVVAGAPATRRRTIRDVLDLPERTRVLRERNVAILHCSDLWALQSWGPAAKSLGVPIVYHHRDFRRVTRLNRLVACLADAVICISASCCENGAAITGKAPDVITNPFVKPAEGCGAAVRRELQALWPEASDLKVVGFAANFIARKQPFLFLEMGAQLVSSCPDVRLVMFGRPREIGVEALADKAHVLGLEQKLFLAGFRSPAEANIAALDLLVAPARHEAFGRTLVEAALVGTPYLALDDGGHREICLRWGGGRLAPLGASPEAFAQIALDILADPRPVSLSLARRDEIALQVAPAAHARAVRGIYAQVLSNKGASQTPAREAQIVRDRHAS